MNDAVRLEDTSILVTDVDRRKSLPIIRSLGRQGVHVIGMASTRFSVGGLSRYCARTLRCPDYRRDPQGWVDFVAETCAAYRPTVFLPIEDKAIELALAHPECFEGHSRALLPSAEVMEISYDKWKTCELAQRLGIPIPQSHCPENVEEVRALAASWQGGCVIKPRKTSGSRGMAFVEDPARIEATWQAVSREFPRPILQQRIDQSGEALGVFVLIDATGELIALFGHKRLREYPISGGPSTLCRSHRDEVLIERSLRLLREIDFRGVAMVEYKRDPASGEALLLEINPRFWGSIGLAIASGVDFPRLYQETVAGLETRPVLEYAPEMYGRWLFPGDLLHFIANPDRLRLEPNFFWFRGDNLVYDILSFDDPLPALGMLVESLRRVAGRSQ